MSKVIEKLFIHKTNSLMRALYPNFLWRKPNNEKKIYLTFDDGPIPEITDFVLETLATYQAKATFFCIGDNVLKHPEVFKKIRDQKHQIGNHTFNHLKGWETNDSQYFKNIEDCENVLFQESSPKLFRPPYGRIKRSQANFLKNDFEIVMWDVLTGDYSSDISPDRCLRKTIESTESGSIVVFHDSIKASKNMCYALPRFLALFSSLAYQFETL